MDPKSTCECKLHRHPPATAFHSLFCFSHNRYSYGVILWELLTRERPWNHLRETEYILFFAALSNALQAGERPELSQDLADAHPDFVAVMQRCWVTDPATRPTFKAVVDALASD